MSSRKLRRKKELAAKKAAKKASKQISKDLSRMPQACDECGVKFDKTNLDMVGSWRIAVYDDGPIHLVCPDCVPDEVKQNS